MRARVAGLQKVAVPSQIATRRWEREGSLHSLRMHPWYQAVCPLLCSFAPPPLHCPCRKNLWRSVQVCTYVRDLLLLLLPVRVQDIEKKQSKIAAAVKQTTQGQIRRRNAAVHELVVEAGSLPAPPPLPERDNEGEVSGQLSKSNIDPSSHHAHNSDKAQELSPLRKQVSDKEKASGRSKPLASLFQNEDGDAEGAAGSSDATEESDIGTSSGGGVEAGKEGEEGKGGKGEEEGAMDSPRGGSGPSRAEMLGGKTSLQLPAVKLVTLAAYARRTKVRSTVLVSGLGVMESCC